MRRSGNAGKVTCHPTGRWQLKTGCSVFRRPWWVWALFLVIANYFLGGYYWDCYKALALFCFIIPPVVKTQIFRALGYFIIQGIIQSLTDFYFNEGELGSAEALIYDWQLGWASSLDSILLWLKGLEILYLIFFQKINASETQRRNTKGTLHPELLFTCFWCQ